VVVPESSDEDEFEEFDEVDEPLLVDVELLLVDVLVWVPAWVS
jgi:hypothetical protein